MFDANHYFVILKAKAGEFESISELDQEHHDDFTPLFEIPPIPFDYEKDQPKYDIDEHLLGYDESFEGSMGENLFYVDLNLIGESERLKDNSHPVTYIFDTCRQRNLLAIPVTGTERDQNYQEAVKNVARLDQRGACLRLSEKHFGDDDFSQKITETISSIELEPESIDLVIDFNDVSNASVSNNVLLIKLLINSVIPNVNEWRSLTISSSSFPESMSEVDSRSVTAIERKEIEIHQRIRSSQQITRQPTFGDYSIASPVIIDVDPRIMNMSASIRYTTEDSWLILKGRGVRTPDSGGFSQFHDLSRALIRMSQYDGRNYSWGDEFIHECANNNTGTGNATTWRKVGNTHHIKKMIEVIANLPSASRS